ncbi:MAG: class I SAM-dependent rRNA methyltransferase [Deltaproteobacteria bacterium]|nr:class I SAM-dependent rRNA methyltransferase [Deltaproteobacteria bacterium]
MDKYKVVVTAKGERWVRSGHPWIFRDDIARMEEPENGTVTSFFNLRGDLLGRGFYSSHSRIALRKIVSGEVVVDDAYWRRILQQVCRAREAYLKTRDQACRLVFSEADGVPGLVADWYAGYLVLQTLIAGTDGLLTLFTDLFQELLGPKAILLRNDVEARKLEKLKPETRVLYGEMPEKLEIREGAIRYRMDLKAGQKTGAYLDQQENRKRLAAYGRPGFRALDCFGYTGGFALHQALTAAEVTAVDDSAGAVAEGRENARLNGLGNLYFVKGNVFEFLKQAEKQKDRFDLITLDPPPFARKKSEVAGAQRGYLELNRRALSVLNPGGILATYSCSHNISEFFFLEILKEAAQKTGRRVFLLEKQLQAPDHPILITFPESYYLKGLVLRVE